MIGGGRALSTFGICFDVPDDLVHEPLEGVDVTGPVLGEPLHFVAEPLAPVGQN